MQTTVPCPVCRHTLTFVAKALGLACPFCRSPIRLPNGKIPVGEKVCCERCQGVFTAETPPPAIRVYESALESCPSCHIVLAIRKDLPPGKKVRCFNCRKKFRPERKESASSSGQESVSAYDVLAEPRTSVPPLPLDPPIQPVPELSEPNGAPRRGVGKRQTRFGRSASRSSITHLANEPLAEDVLSPEVPSAAPAGPPPSTDDDEVDFFHQEPTVGFEAPKPAPAPGPKPARQAAKARTKARRKRAAIKPAPEPMEHPPLPTQEEIPSTSAVLEALAKKWHAASADAEITPTETDDIQVEDAPEEPTAAHPEHANGSVRDERAPRPLSMASALEQAAATSLLEEPETNEAPEPLDESPEFVSPAPGPIYKPTASPQPALPRPTPVAAPKPASSGGGWQLNIDWKKALTYTAPPLLLILGVYYLFTGGGLGKPRAYKTDGIVTLEGKPAVGARVTLYPENKKRNLFRPTGKVGEDGTFELSTYQPGDGAPVGRYRVTIDRGQMDAEEYKELTKKFNPNEIAEIDQKRQEDPLYSRFSNPRDSGLTAEIIAGPSNRLTFELKLDQ